MQPPEIQFTEKDGFSIAYQVWGNAPDTLIYVPGMVSHLDVSAEGQAYLAWLKLLSKYFKVIIFDKRGQGLSDRDATVPGVEQRMDDIDAVAAAEGVEKFYLFGYSEGGSISLVYAATHPTKVLGVTVFAGIPKFTNSDDFDLMSDEETILEGFVPNWGKGLSGYLFCPQKMPHGQKEMSKLERMVCSPSTLKNVLETNFKVDVRSTLSSVQVPCLICHARDDRAVPVANGRYFADKIEHSKYIEYPSGGHFPHFGNINQIVSDIVSFFNDVSQTADPLNKSLTTVLFTDIVNSTEKMLAMGDREWAGKIIEHDQIVSTLVGRYNGTLIKNTGDGCLCVFDGPVRASKCAIELRNQLSSVGLEIRCGLNFGQVEWVDSDVIGKTVNLSARVMDLAKANQIFATKDTVDVLAGAGLEINSAGRYQLKGFKQEWDIYEVS